MKRLLILLAALILTIGVTPANAKPLTLNQIAEASSRITTSVGDKIYSGSGVCVWSDKDYHYVLTSAHVVDNAKHVGVEFFRYGKKTSRLQGSVIWKQYEERTNKDFAIVRLNNYQFTKNFKPRVIPLAPKNHKINRYEYIASAGSPGGRWLQCWEGYTTSNISSFAMFTPAPQKGQSGSAICVNIDDKTYVGGIIAWTIGRSGVFSNGFDRAQGAAIPSSTIREAIDGTLKPSKIPDYYYQAKDVLDRKKMLSDSRSVVDSYKHSSHAEFGKTKTINKPASFVGGFGYGSQFGGYGAAENNRNQLLGQVEFIEKRVQELQADGAKNKETIQSLQTANLNYAEQNQALVVQNESLTIQRGELELRVDSIESDVSDVKTQRDGVLGLAGAGGVGAVAWYMFGLYWRRRGKGKVEGIIDGVQNVDASNKLHDLLDSLEGRLAKRIDEALTKPRDGV